MSYLLWHTIGDPSGNWLGILDEEKSDLTKPRLNFNYQKRTNDTVREQVSYAELWPATCFLSADQSQGYFMSGVDNTSGLSEAESFEPWSASTGGSARSYFILGNVTDNNGNPLAACVLELFLTSTNAYVSSGQTDSGGNFMLATPFNAQQHYIYANYANGTFVGGSVTTLTPNF